jgi:hypothetical protein
MKLPVRAWLEYEVALVQDDSTARQTAIFDPAGLPGLVYLYALCPFHRLIFAGMLRAFASAVEKERGHRVEQ